MNMGTLILIKIVDAVVGLHVEMRMRASGWILPNTTNTLNYEKN